MSNQGTPPSPSTLANRGIQPRFGELGQSCRKLMLNHLAASLERTFAQIDDTLFEAAEKAENNQVQSLFFDSMRNVRKLRPQIERLYHQTVSQGLSEFLAGQLNTPVLIKVQADELALIQNDDYEESLQVINMASRVKNRCAQLLFALDHRLAMLNNGQPLNEGSNPFAPLAIAQAFRVALAPCDLPLRIKLVLYTLFDHHVMQDLDKVYTALDQRLLEAGILPNLKFAAARASSPASPATATIKEGGSSAEEPSASEMGQLLEGLHSLLADYRREYATLSMLGNSPSMDSFAPAGAGRTYDAAQLLDALDRMQRQSAAELAQRLQQPQQVAGFKADLQRQLAEHCALPEQHRLGSQETDVIDLVGMLFDFILNDDALPQTYKVALSHLHTPYLKVALLDKALFTRRHHPARRLIDAMAKAGVLYGAQNESHGLLAKVQWIVEQVIRRFDKDLELFDELLGELDAFTAALKQRVDLQERRAVESAKGRDKLLAARHGAAQVIARSLSKRAPPLIIRHFLERTWIDVLVFILLRSGAQSPQWQRACELAENLAWSAMPLSAAELERLQQMRVGMLEEIRSGLLLLGGYHEDSIRKLLQDLVTCQHAVQAGQPQIADRLDAPQASAALGAMLGDESPLQRPTLSAQAQSLVAELEKLEFGTWFEFVQGDQRQTLKLSWYSPTTRNYMFVDHRGQRAAVKSIEQLAWEMDHGQARLSAPDRASPVVDRALTAVYRVLQQLTGRTP